MHLDNHKALLRGGDAGEVDAKCQLAAAHLDCDFGIPGFTGLQIFNRGNDLALFLQLPERCFVRGLKPGVKYLYKEGDMMNTRYLKDLPVLKKGVLETFHVNDIKDSRQFGLRFRMRFYRFDLLK